MNKTNISWCTHTWNPVTGCKRGCKYCYAKALHDKRYTAYQQGSLQNLKQYSVPFEEIVFHPERLKDPMLKRKESMVIFVGSMTDHYYWTIDVLEKVLITCSHYKQHTLMFLTKNADGYQRGTIRFTDNTMQGLTIESTSTIRAHENMDMLQYCKRPFLSIEPLLGPVKYHSVFDKCELIIVGAMTGKNAIVPEKEWIESVIANCPAEKIHWKPNIWPWLRKYGLEGVIEKSKVQKNLHDNQ